MGNTVEACGRMTEGKTFIHLNSCLENGVFTIAMDTSFDGRPSKQEEKFLSSMRNRVGIGLFPIQAVASAHPGDTCFKAEANVFHSLVYVNL